MNVPSWMSEYYPFHWKWEAHRLEYIVRSSIFIISSACACLPALVWSISELIHHRKNGHRISAFIILLLLTDFVELFLSPYILIKYLLGESTYRSWTCRVLFSLWFLSRNYGLLLNQLVALEGILSVRFPLYTASVFSSPYFIIFYILMFLCISFVDILIMQEYNFFIVLSMFIVLLITWIISCGASCSADRHSRTTRKPDHHILFFFIFNLLVIYLPLNLFNLFLYSTPYLVKLLSVWRIPWFLAHVRLISDPLLCVLVCRQNLSIQTSQTPEGTSLV